MNEFTEQEKQMINKLKNPMISMNIIQSNLDRKAIKAGYKSFADMKEKTGWINRFKRSW